MDCAGFESALLELLEPERDPRERAGLVERLLRHAETCADCAPSRDLVETWAAPASERDRADDPGPVYWSGFEQRVRARIDREPATGSSRIGRRMFAAAALVALVVVGAWIARRGVERAPVVSGSRGEQEALAEAPPETAMPDDLTRQLARATPDEALVQVDALAGWAGSWEDRDGEPREAWGVGGPFPDVSDLDNEASEALLKWLREQSS